MASIILPLAISGSRKADGTVNAGGRVYLSLIDSPNSSVTGYIDRNKSAAATLDGGGYVLDAAGKIALFIDTACRVRTEDASGVAVDSYTYEPTTNEGLVEVDSTGYTGVDPTSGQLVGGGRTTLATVLSSLYSSLGGLDGKYRGVYGTTDTTYKSELEQICLTPQRFGAKGDGVNDDTTPFLLLAAAQSASGIPVFIPRGTYRLTAAITFGSSVVLSGAGANSTNGTIIQQANTAASGLIFGSNAKVSDILLSAPSGSSGVGITVGAAGKLSNVNVSATGGWATGASASGATGFMLNRCDISGTIALSGGTWNLDSSSVYTGTVTIASLILGGAMSYNTADVANGGSFAPTILSGAEQFYRIRGTTAAGTGTINPPSNALNTRASRLIMEFQATGGGTFTFNMNAIFHGTSNTTGAITSAQRQVWSYVFNPLDSVWVLQSLTATFA
jgi:hypothetical protein